MINFIIILIQLKSLISLTKFRFAKLSLRKLDLKRIKLLWQELTFEMVQKKNTCIISQIFIYCTIYMEQNFS